MILELAVIDVVPGHESDFETGFAKAKLILEKATGLQSVTVKHCIEQPNRYVLLIEWDSLESHTVDFRNSDVFEPFRALFGEFIEPSSSVQHYAEVSI